MLDHQSKNKDDGAAISLTWLFNTACSLQSVHLVFDSPARFTGFHYVDCLLCYL